MNVQNTKQILISNIELCGDAARPHAWASRQASAANMSSFLCALAYVATAASFSSQTVVHRAPTHATRASQNSPPIVIMKGTDGIKQDDSSDGSTGKDVRANLPS